MKVAYLLGSLNRGGAETLVLDVSRNANKAPFEMLCIHRKGGAYIDDYYSSGITMIQCAPRRLDILRYLWQLRKHLMQENVTIVHAQQSLDCVYAWLATIGTDIRVIETFHGYDYGRRRFDKFVNALSVRMADVVCFVSKAELDYYVENYRIRHQEKLHVVYNGIDFSKLDASYPIPDFLAEKSNKVRLTMVGNFVKGRSQKVLVEAIKMIDKEEELKEKLDFYFIGRRDEKQAWRYDECVQYCKKHHLDNVHFMGARSDVPAVLKTMDGFVYSTVHDTFGIAVVEAIAAGLPIVVNDWDVMKEVCGEANEGIRYFKSGEAEDAAEKIKELLENFVKSKKVAEANAKRVRGQYSIERHIERLSGVYSGVCKE